MKRIGDMDPKLAKSFKQAGVAGDWADVLAGYTFNGWYPGSFFESVLANDLFGATGRSHLMNSWHEIIKVANWIKLYAPPQSYGSYENVNSWIALPTKEKHIILIKQGIMCTSKELEEIAHAHTLEILSTEDLNEFYPF